MGRGCQSWEVQGTNCCPGRSQHVPGSWICVGKADSDDRPGGGANRPQDTPPFCQAIKSFICFYFSSLFHFPFQVGSTQELSVSCHPECSSGSVATGVFLLSVVCSHCWGTKLLPCLWEGGVRAGVAWMGSSPSQPLPYAAQYPLCPEKTENFNPKIDISTFIFFLIFESI